MDLPQVCTGMGKLTTWEDVGQGRDSAPLALLRIVVQAQMDSGRSGDRSSCHCPDKKESDLGEADFEMVGAEPPCCRWGER